MVIYKNVSFLPFRPSEMALIIAPGCLASSPSSEATTGPSPSECDTQLAFYLGERSIYLRNSSIIYI